MQTSLPVGVGPVAVHRWFARGEDWALHPWYRDHLDALLRALDERIKARRAGAFQVEALGGMLVGELLDDPNCLDPLAARRHPCVLRVVLVRGRLTDSARAEVLAGLQSLALPETPGTDPRLILAVPEGPTSGDQPLPRCPVASVPPSVERPRRKWLVLGGGVAAALATMGILLALRASSREGNPPRPEPGDRTRQGAKKADDAPRPPVVDAELTALLARYRRVDHPHVVFLLDHPGALTQGRQPDEPSYDEWRREQQRRQRVFAHADRPIPRRLRERVALWRQPDEGLRLVIEEMRRLRHRWAGAGAEPAAMPVEEIELFFAHVVRPERLPPRAELDHPGNAFLWRLPASPLAAGRTFDTAGDLVGPLRRLLEGLRDRPGETPAAPLDLLASIERELDHGRWRREQERAGIVFADGDTDPGEVVRSGLRRFPAPGS